MSTAKAIFYALVITIISAFFLTISRGWPTIEQVLNNCTMMFIVAFIVMKFVYPKKRRIER